MNSVLDTTGKFNGTQKGKAAQRPRQSLIPRQGNAMEFFDCNSDNELLKKANLKQARDHTILIGYYIPNTAIFLL